MKKNITFFLKAEFISFKSLIITLCLMLFFLSNTYAQNSDVTKSTTLTKIKSTDWQLLLSNETVTVNYKYVDCDLPSEGTHNENVYLQFINKTDKELEAQWNTEYWYNNKCHGCDSGDIENRKTVVLKPNQTLEGSCSVACNQALKIFSQMLNQNIKSKLTNFNLRDLKITFNSNSSK